MVTYSEPRRRRAPRALALLTSMVLCLAACRPMQAGADEPPSPRPNPQEQTLALENGWKEIDRLVSEQKLEAASELAAALRADAREKGDEEAWARALIREVQLRTGLHGYETAVRFLRQEPWPEGERERLVLELFYAHSLMHYLQVYSWEIAQRERVDTGGEVDLKAWSQDQIFEEAMAAFARVWEERQDWGDQSLGALAEYFESNGYPARIRGTLRDTVTYLWQEALANSAFWTPEESQGIYRLGLPKILEVETSADPTDAEAHPLLRIAGILGDLRAWHRDEERPEAAFEARRVLLEVLRSSFAESEDKDRILRALEEDLDRLGSRFPWWSVGMATRAEWVRQGQEPDALIDALAIAREGRDRHPETIGGKRCRSIAESILQPHYSLLSMTADGPRRRSIQVQHKNLERLWFRAYAVDLDQRIETSRDYNLLPAHQEIETLVKTGKAVGAWSVDLPPTVDYRIHDTYVTPPAGALEEPGLYVVVASARKDFRDSGNAKTAVHLMVTPLVMLSTELHDHLEVTVVDGESGEPVRGAEVVLYRYDWQKGHRPDTRRTTSADGRVRFDYPNDGRHRHFLLARKGDARALDPRQLRLFERPDAGERRASLVYTDRSIYRPQQEILWKVVAYVAEGEAGRFETLPETPLTITLVDPNGQEVESAPATTNAFGSASGSFRVPTGRLLGQWQVRSSLPGQTGVRVEEYKRPTFEAAFLDPASALRLNRPATLTGEVEYYFGLPVVSGKVAWRVSREPIFPYWWWWRPPSVESRIIAAGATELGADGRFTVEFTPEADERLAGDETRPDRARQVSYRYRVTAEVTAQGGETRTASRVFRLGFVAVEAAVSLEQGFLVAGEEASIQIQRSDLDGIPRAGEGSWTLSRVEQPEEPVLPAQRPVPAPEPGFEVYQTPGDLLRPRWETDLGPRSFQLWEDGEEVAEGTLDHGEDGAAILSLPSLAPGVYRLRYSTKDEFGARFETQRELIVAPGRDAEGGKDRESLVLPLALRAERSSVAVGQTARILAHSALEDQDLVFERFQGGRRVERRVLSSGAGPRILEIPVTAAERGGFVVRLSTVEDYQHLLLEERILVPWDDRRLTFEFATFRDTLRPGSKETWRLVVQGDDEEALHEGAAEVLAYMVDRSLDLFAPHQPFDPLGLYPSISWAPQLVTNLGAGGEVWRSGRGLGRPSSYPYLNGDRLKFFDGYGIGGMGRRARGGVFVQESMVLSAPAAAKSMNAEFSASLDMADSAEQEEGVTFRGGSPREEDGAAPPPAAEEPVRSNFAETAFWHPHLRTQADGSVAIEVEVPDSVTEWNLWVVGLTRDLAGGVEARKVKTVKELLVRPYLPRFLRQGDRAELKVVVNNAGEEAFDGRLDFTIEDPETGEDLSSLFGLSPEQIRGVPFDVAVGGSAELTFPVTAPRRLGTVAFRAVGRAGSFSDGELRPLPVLPSRVHLAQSRFAALKDVSRRELVFPELAADDDPSRIHEQLVVTVDGQLFYSVLAALPYLVDYPYECTEQTLNRFLSTGIVGSLYGKYPAVAAMAEKLSERETPLEAWDEPDPNRKMALEETPWLVLAQGGRDDLPLINVLDPAIAKAHQQASLAKLEKAQTSLGAFPWWPGGPPSPYMTMYLLQGFSRALEFGVEVPRPMVQKAWAYLHRHYLDELVREMVDDECCWERITFLNYLLSNYALPADGEDGAADWTGGVFSADDRRRMLDFSFRHWKEHSPLLKGLLTLTLVRAGRADEAALVFDSVMDSAKTEEDLGTYWAPEDRAWLWYNDTIETHALALRVLGELDPDDPRREGIVQWLMLNKKLNHWKSTRATAEVLYSLVHYLEQEGTLGVREAATVTAGPVAKTFVFEPDEYTGKGNQLVIPGPEVEPSMSTVTVEKETPGLLFASATWHFSTEELPEEAQGDFLSVERSYFKRVQAGGEWTLRPLADGERLEPGDTLEVHLSLRSRAALEYVHLRDPRGAGFEPETLTSGYHWNLGLGWYEEVRDSGTNFFFDRLPVGEHTFKYRLRATLGGDFRVGPATVQPMYAPEMVAYSSGARLVIE